MRMERQLMHIDEDRYIVCHFNEDGSFDDYRNEIHTDNPTKFINEWRASH